MTRRMLLVLTFVLGALLSVVGAAAAQDPAPEIDIAAIGDVVLGTDPEALAVALETPPEDAGLPEGFVNPPSGTPEYAELVEEFAGGIGEIEGAIGSTSHGFNTDPAVVPGLISTGIITYIVAEEEITAEDLDDFEEGASERPERATPAAVAEVDGATPALETDIAVERFELGGAEAVVITFSVELGATSAVVQIVAVPVGNTMVMGSAVVADLGPVDAGEVQEFAEALTLAGVAHLAAVAEVTQ